MDAKFIAFEKWVELLITELNERYPNPLVDSRERKLAIKECQTFPSELKNLLAKFPFIAKEGLCKIDTKKLSPTCERYVEFFLDADNAQNRPRPGGRRRLPISLIELFFLGFEFVKGDKELQFKLYQTLKKPDETSTTKCNSNLIGKIYETHLEVNSKRTIKLGDLPQVPAQLQDYQWINKHKDIYLNYLIETYSDVKSIRFAEERKYFFPKSTKKTKAKEIILKILIDRYKFNGFE
jgi:hypothetical protein